MPTNWTLVRLAEVTEWASGGTPPKSTAEYWGGDIPWISARSMKSGILCESDRTLTQAGLAKGSRLAEKGTVLVLVRGSELHKRIPIGVAAKSVAFNQDVKALTAKGGLSNRYLFYWLLANEPLLLSKVEHTGIGAGKLDTGVLQNLEVALPPLGEQTEITEILGTLDDKIELNRRMSETLEQIARTQFRDWFADKLGKVQAGECPSWKVKPLDEIADFLNGAACQRFPPIEGEPWLPVIKIRELHQGITEQSDRVAANIPEKWHIKDGDVLFSWSGTLLAKKWTGGNAALNQHLFKVTSAKYPKWFYFQWVLHHLEAFRSIAADKATTMGHIRRHHLTEALCVVPDSDSLSEMGAIMEPIHRRWLMCELESRTLAELRDTLLPKLITGELRVPEAEQLVSEVA